MNESYEFYIVVNPEEERNEYWFYTNQSLLYYVYFVAAPEYLPEFSSYSYLCRHGYVIGFCPVDEDAAAEAPHDPCIGRTICNILKDFINRHDKVILVYHCDPSDGLQRARKVTFNKWHKVFGGEVGIHKSGVEITIQQPGGLIRKEYLGYLASCEEEEIPGVEAEFQQFASEKANSEKQPM